MGKSAITIPSHVIDSNLKKITGLGVQKATVLGTEL